MAIKSAMGPLFALLLLFAQLSFAMESTDKGVSSTESILCSQNPMIFAKNDYFLNFQVSVPIAFFWIILQILFDVSFSF